MSGGAGFPVDLVLFGMIAAFLVLRLRSILGRRTGFERPPQPISRCSPTVAQRVIDAEARTGAPPTPARPLPDPASALGQALAKMSRSDRNFAAGGFLDGAEKAFRDDRRRLCRLRPGGATVAAGGRHLSRLRDGDRRTRGGRAAQVSELRGIQSATIEAAELRNTVAQITVRFVSDQVSLTPTRTARRSPAPMR